MGRGRGVGLNVRLMCGEDKARERRKAGGMGGRGEEGG